jgi:hypothetical protein
MAGILTSGAHGTGDMTISTIVRGFIQLAVVARSACALKAEITLNLGVVAVFPPQSNPWPSPLSTGSQASSKPSRASSNALAQHNQTFSPHGRLT